MCGIWAYLLNNKISIDFNKIFANFVNIKGRGPDNLKLFYNRDNYMLGFHRLSIMDTSSKGMQPFEVFENNIKYTCICNGEIYNAEDIKKTILDDTVEYVSNSDCEVLIPLYKKYGEDMLQYLDGVFAFIIIKEIGCSKEVFVARDRFGIRPLYIGEDDLGNIVFSSELKGMKDLVISANQFEPGTYSKIVYTENSYIYNNFKYYNFGKLVKSEKELESYNVNEKAILEMIKSNLIDAVKKRLISDRPVCALLSGGLDSSLVCSIASKLLSEKGKKLHTFSIGISGSPDNKYAKLVADYIGSEHTTITITQDQAIKALNDVIWATETYDITTIRASTGQYLVSKYIADNSDFKVVLSGDGSDEVTNGYLENFLAPSLVELQNNALKRVSNIHFYDVLRADRATSCHGLELRVPFLDEKFVRDYINIHPKYKMPNKDRCEKYLLREAFKDGYLPDEVLWRQKEAFSDGISTETNSWHKIIQNMCDKILSDDDILNCESKYTHCTPKTKEALYFRNLFTQKYGEKIFDKIIPSFWMPNWSNTTDPSARTLNIYDRTQKNEVNI